VKSKEEQTKKQKGYWRTREKEAEKLVAEARSKVESIRQEKTRNLMIYKPKG
jgi:hypothetical protein